MHQLIPGTLQQHNRHMLTSILGMKRRSCHTGTFVFHAPLQLHNHNFTSQLVEKRFGVNRHRLHGGQRISTYSLYDSARCLYATIIALTAAMVGESAYPPPLQFRALLDASLKLNRES